MIYFDGFDEGVQMGIGLLTAFLLLAAPPSAFQAHVRPTDPLSPAEEAASFHVPPGFHVELVASEPDIYKPMNLAFDAAGRLWVSESIEYPFAAEAGKGRDRIQVFEDADGDGRYEKRTTFVDGLNIPIGLIPYRNGVIAYSIPNIYFFQDTDGDGLCDRREVLYGPLGQPRDTHGMQNAFRRGYDGWIYVCHGFSNESTITAKDGSSIQLQSGNTYRIRPDGSRVEQFTWGQVNPFGSTFTPWGDVITADCHSKPLTLLLRGGYYSSFGKPHGGLGYVPPLMDHAHGSTAIAGAAYYDADLFPEEYRGRLFVGNVVTSRINTDTLHFSGATAKAKEQPDFVTSDDPWFRPVDIQVGPDGALYVADFYNRIIGHYEVPLDHPGRDRHRGRIWRIGFNRQVSEENADSAILAKPARLDTATAHELIAALGASNLDRSRLAIDQLSDRVGAAAAPLVREALLAPETSERARIGCLWTLHRLRGLDDEEATFACEHESKLLRIHAIRALSETTNATSAQRMLVAAATRDKDALVRRNAADAIGQLGDLELLQSLLSMASSTQREDVYLWRTIQIAVAQLLRQENGYERAQAIANKENLAFLAQVSLGVKTPQSAAFLMRWTAEEPAANMPSSEILQHVASYLPVEQLDGFVRLVRSQTKGDLELQQRLLLAMESKLKGRSGELPSNVKAWAKFVAEELLESAQPSLGDWAIVQGENCWDVELRDCEDGTKQVAFLSSLPGGERARGVLRSKLFALPERLSFYLCGHLGIPGKPADRQNVVALRLEKGARIVMQAHPPRNDLARQIVWDLTEYAGQKGYLEIVDGLSESGYAWLAVSRFEPPVARVPKAGPRKAANQITAAARVAEAFQLVSLREPLVEIASRGDVDWRVCVAAAKASAAFRPDLVKRSLAEIAGDASTPLIWRLRLSKAAVSESTDDSAQTVIAMMREVPSVSQQFAASVLASSEAGATLLLDAVEQGAASRRLLQHRLTLERLATHKSKAIAARIAKITADLPPIDQQLAQQINAALDDFRQTSASVSKGRLVFEKNCEICHQVGGKGAPIGPQLDGIGNRGIRRVAEDVLDPNRNVDQAFRTVVAGLRDGRVVSGLVRRKEAQTWVLADNKGKEFSVRESDVDTFRMTLSSLMPANFGELLKSDEIRDLLGYLETLRAAPPQTPETP